MKLSIDRIIELIKEKGLKVTPQRMAILEAVYKAKCHPTAENIVESIRKSHPSIATGTVYKILDVLVDKQLIRKVKTEKDIMRYDGFMEKHHHLYSSESDKIEDYVDNELDEILEKFFNKKEISNFKIKDFRLHLVGDFLNDKK